MQPNKSFTVKHFNISNRITKDDIKVYWNPNKIKYDEFIHIELTHMDGDISLIRGGVYCYFRQLRGMVKDHIIDDYCNKLKNNYSVGGEPDGKERVYCHWWVHYDTFKKKPYTLTDVDLVTIRNALTDILSKDPFI